MIKVGDTFGRLVVLEIAPDRVRVEEGRPRHYKMALVRCTCGTEKVAYQNNLRRGLSTSCGCVTIERARAARRASRKPLPTYDGAHERMRRDRGPARNHLCPCGKQAEQWAYEHTDPNELTDTYVRPSGSLGTLVYSVDPDHYIAMCRKCHKHYDRLARHLRRAGIHPRDIFGRRNVSREQAEHMRAAMPNPDWFEIATEED